MHPFISNVSNVLMKHGFTASQPLPNQAAGFQVYNDMNGDILVAHTNSKADPEMTLQQLEAYRSALEEHWSVLLDENDQVLLVTAQPPI